MSGAGGLVMTIFASMTEFVERLADRWGDLNAFIVAHLGEIGQYAFWAFSALVVLIIVTYATKLVYNLAKWVLVPSALLSIAGLTLAPSISPMQTFPVFIGVTTLVMLVKAR
ncbi:MAG TPA: hypothetical protein VNN55_06215 [bacterium]|nr:hypothetical protein [bacterium]